MSEIQRIDTKKSGPHCMHCGKWLGVQAHMEGRTSYGMPVLKRELGLRSDEETGHTDIDIVSHQIDYYHFCDECFSVLDMQINEFILYPKLNNFIIGR